MHPIFAVHSLQASVKAQIKVHSTIAGPHSHKWGAGPLYKCTSPIWGGILNKDIQTAATSSPQETLVPLDMAL